MRSETMAAGDPRIPWWQSPVTIVLTAALIRGALLLTYEGTVQDGATRVATTVSWLTHGVGFFGRTPWPEGNYLLPAAALLLWNEPYWSVRILYALVGLTNVWLLYVLGVTLYGRAAGAIAAWILACMPFHAQQSVEIATSEVPYLSCVVLSLIAVVRYAVRPSPWLAMGAGLALTLATSFRFDGVVWGIPLGASIIVAALRHRLPLLQVARDVALFGLCALAFPAVLLVRWTQLYPDPFHIFAWGKQTSEEFFTDGAHARWPRWLYQAFTVGFWPTCTFILLTPLVAALGWTGAAQVVRERRLVLLPVTLGILVICIWLGYAASRHAILVQWRYGLIIAALLCVFCLPGAQALTRLWPALTGKRIAAAAVVTALATAACVSALAFLDKGVLTRQIGMLSPIRPGQFASRDVLKWIDSSAGASGPILITPHVREQEYLTLHLPELERTATVIAPSSFRPGGQLTQTHATLTEELRRDLARSCYVVTTTSTRELGLHDGLYRELVTPVHIEGDRYVWGDVELRLIRRFGSDLVWGVVHSEPGTCPR